MSFLSSISLGILVKRNEGFLLLKVKETKLTLCISANNSSEVDLLQQQGSLWSENYRKGRSLFPVVQTYLFTSQWPSDAE